MIVHVGPLLSILFGLLILIFPKALNYLVADGLLGESARDQLAHSELGNGAADRAGAFHTQT